MLRKIKDIIDEGDRFLITTHVDPDGDAIGSCFALYWALRAIGKQPAVFMRDPIPYMYQFLPRPPDLVHGELPEGHYDALFVLDCGNLFRVGNGHERLKLMGSLVNIDHHTTNEPFGILNVVNQDASSTAEILYNIFRYLSIPFGFDIAVNIYTAVFTDTGSFRYPNTNTEAFEICKEMIGYGVSPSQVAQMVHENHPKERFLLLGKVLTSLETYKNDTVAVAVVTQDMFRETHTSKEYTEGFVEHIKEIRGIDVAVVIREITNHQYKISMRSKGNTDVARICNLLGGGGHRNAAGCTIEGTLGETKNKLKEALSIP